MPSDEEEDEEQPSEDREQHELMQDGGQQVDGQRQDKPATKRMRT
jgi:hypothetical protein